MDQPGSASPLSLSTLQAGRRSRHESATLHLVSTFYFVFFSPRLDWPSLKGTPLLDGSQMGRDGLGDVVQAGLLDAYLLASCLAE